MADRTPSGFGKRSPARLPDAPPTKRSNHVALLLMGTLAVGGGAYALMPSETCQPAAPGVVAPGVVAPGVVAPGMAQPPATTCTTRTSSSSGGGGSGYSRSRWSFFGGSSSSGSSSGTSESSSHVTRGGFGSFGHMFSGGG
jgi:hypothetical protein